MSHRPCSQIDEEIEDIDEDEDSSLSGHGGRSGGAGNSDHDDSEMTYVHNTSKQVRTKVTLRKEGNLLKLPLADRGSFFIIDNRCGCSN